MKAFGRPAPAPAARHRDRERGSWARRPLPAIAAARARGIAVGVPISDFTLAAGYLERGVTLFATTDRGIVANGMANFLRSI